MEHELCGTEAATLTMTFAVQHGNRFSAMGAEAPLTPTSVYASSMFTGGSRAPMVFNASARRGRALGKESREQEVTMTVTPSRSSSTQLVNCSIPSPTTLVSKHAARGALGGSRTAAHMASRPTTTLLRPHPSIRSTPFTSSLQLIALLISTQSGGGASVGNSDDILVSCGGAGGLMTFSLHPSSASHSSDRTPLVQIAGGGGGLGGGGLGSAAAPILLSGFGSIR